MNNPNFEMEDGDIDRGIMATIRLMLKNAGYDPQLYSTFNLVCKLIELEDSYNDNEYIYIFESLARHQHIGSAYEWRAELGKDNLIATFFEYVAKHCNLADLANIRDHVECAASSIKHRHAEEAGQQGNVSSSSPNNEDIDWPEEEDWDIGVPPVSSSSNDGHNALLPN